MSLTYTPHRKIRLRKHTQFNEAWLQDRICTDPTILGLGDVRLVEKEKVLPGGGRLDLLLFDEDNNRRYEVEIMLGATDPSHIIRTLEYWDLERRRYPGYDHIAVLIAEDITARFLNVMSLLAGSIPLIAIQLDALQVDDRILLNFVQVLDQTDLRQDDPPAGDEKEASRADWDNKAGTELMAICDAVLEMVNSAARSPQELNYRQGHIGLRSNGVVNNFVNFLPKPSKKLVHVGFKNSNALDWKDKFETDGAPVQSRRKGHFRVSLNPHDFNEHRDRVREAVVDTVREIGA